MHRHRQLVHRLVLAAVRVATGASSAVAQTGVAGSAGEWLTQYSSARTLG